MDTYSLLVATFGKEAISHSVTASGVPMPALTRMAAMSTLAYIADRFGVSRTLCWRK
jgi:hypothetical protein